MSRLALVVDDSRATRALLKRMLASLDFEVAEAGHGLEFIKAVRADRAWDGLKVVMVTSENESARIARALMAGADEYAMKPCTADALAEKLELAAITAVRS